MEANQRPFQLLDFARIAQVTLDRAGRVIDANRAAFRLLGCNHAALIGAPFSLHVSKPDAHIFRTHISQCTDSGGQLETRLRLKGPRGQIIHAHLSASPGTTATRVGSPLYQTAIFDLNAVVAAEKSLRRSEARYRALFDLIPDAIYVCDADGRILEHNQKAAQLWGRRPRINGPAATYGGAFKLFHPDGRIMRRGECPVARTLRGEPVPPASSEVVIERRDGTRRNVNMSSRALKDEQGDIIGAITCLHDTTRWERAEQALLDCEELGRALMRQTALGMARLDRKGRFIAANPKFCEIAGYTESELIDEPLRKLIPGHNQSVSLKLFRQLVDCGVPYRREEQYRRKNGSTVWLHISALRLRDTKGKTREVIAIAGEISDQKNAEARLERVSTELEKGVRQRARDLAAASEEREDAAALRRGLENEILEISDREQQRLGRELHDGLCQHLTAVAFMAHSIAVRLKHHRVIEVEDIERIANLIETGANDARDIARSLHSPEVNSADLMSALRALVTRTASKTPCRLDVHAPLDVSDGTASQLFRIVREALINANKHARARMIVLGIEKSHGKTIVSVTDDGVGIGKRRRKEKGIGFHIMDYRARSVGGRLQIKSTRSHGTRVECHLPER